jgi:DNA-binding IclR family transcriptional regulator
MNVLNLILKQKYFDSIMAGQKVQEFREVKPTTYKKLVQLDENGCIARDENGNSFAIKYDAIRFYVGYNKDRDSALVEVTDAYTELFVDENNNVVSYDIIDPRTKQPDIWYAEQVVFCLGKILETDIKPQNKQRKV